MQSDESFTRFRPELAREAGFLAPSATIVGDVTIGAGSSVWFGSVLRGDTEAIRIGRNSNVQDLCLLHADPGFPCVVGDGVTLGHGAIVHGASIEDDVMIAMRAVVMNGARVGRGSIVAVGAVVTQGTEIPPASVVMGIPGKVVGPAGPDHLQTILETARHYVENARRYAASHESSIAPDPGAPTPRDFR